MKKRNKRVLYGFSNNNCRKYIIDGKKVRDPWKVNNDALYHEENLEEKGRMMPMKAKK